MLVFRFLTASPLCRAMNAQPDVPFARGAPRRERFRAARAAPVDEPATLPIEAAAGAGIKAEDS